MKPRFTLVHLDVDGTLVDTRADLTASTNHVRASFGLPPLEPESVYKLVGRGARVLVERALGARPTETIDEGVARFLEHYGAHCLDHTVAYPGLVGMIDRLRLDGVVFSAVTNKPEFLSRRILDGLGLTPKLVAIVGGDTFPERKPDPRGVEHVRVLTCAFREDSLMVGDSPIDVETARRGGIACAGVLWGLDPEGLRPAAPDFLVEDAAALERVIRGASDS
jgi:phosphoglycolate phosphatase